MLYYGVMNRKPPHPLDFNAPILRMLATGAKSVDHLAGYLGEKSETRRVSAALRRLRKDGLVRRDGAGKACTWALVQNHHRAA